MKHYLVKKFFILLFSIFVVATLTFVLLQVVPGDPFSEDKAVPAEIMKAMYHHYGLDQPWHIQYFRYIKGLVTFDLGPSFKYQGRTVTEIITEGFPVSFMLGCEALGVSMLMGIGLGCLSALFHLKWQDHLSMVGAVLGISVPSFILATFLQYVFAMKLDWFPVARWGGFTHTILPTLALSALPTAFIARLTRSNMVEIMQQDYIQTARAKGISTWSIVVWHGLRNALVPLVSYLGPLTTTILTGSFAVEKIFGIPGLGQWFVMSIMNRDYTVIMGVTVFYSAILMCNILIVDILYSLIDPRIRIIKKVT